MTEAIIILPNMRGGCATVGDTVHTLFRVSNRRQKTAQPISREASETIIENRPGSGEAAIRPLPGGWQPAAARRAD
jgi:hypothetical protein